MIFGGVKGGISAAATVRTVLYFWVAVGTCDGFGMQGRLDKSYTYAG